MPTCPTCGAPLAAINSPLSPRAQESSLQSGETMESGTSDWAGGLLVQGQPTLGLLVWLSHQLEAFYRGGVRRTQVSGA